ncbi:HAD-like protein [Pterulicium gracile]|uniref:HAD-like protein n=1 Tax=Pterulicium gracile TaxID=1884261 RepID=A0A5C3R227_9AGAR|nr:HAD-like protein [Pterula gracilis]
MLKAVIFDIGGVVLRSPFIAIAEYEQELGLPKDYINVSIRSRGSDGAWQQFERGELPLLAFYQAFSRDLSDTTANNASYSNYCTRKGNECPALPSRLQVDGRELFGRMMRSSSVYDPYVLKAIQCIRQAGQHRIIALTNNFSAFDSPEQPIADTERAFLGWGDEGPVPEHLRRLFDDFCDSSSLGLRKPDEKFYLLACERNDVAPQETIFLDDIPENIKAAKAIGMDTIRVHLGHTLDAVKILEEKLGIDLTTPEGGDVSPGPSPSAKL